MGIQGWEMVSETEKDFCAFTLNQKRRYKYYLMITRWTSLVAQTVKRLSTMRETQV